LGLPRVVFMGSDAIALPLVECLAGGCGGRVELAAVVTQPDRPVGRGRRLRANPVAAFAEGLPGLPVFKPGKPGPELVAWIRGQEIALVLVMAYGHILKPELIAAPARAMVNFHASLLPRLRGASPVETAVATGEAETGVTLMQVVPRMDAGPVAGREAIPVGAQDTGGSMRQKLAHLTVPLLERLLEPLLAGTCRFEAQEEAEATYCRKLTREDGVLDFRASAGELAQRIRGLDPWPGCTFTAGEDSIKVRGARALAGEAREPPGTVLGTGEHGLRVATGEGVLAIAELQRPGGKMLPAADFLRGYELPAMTRLRSEPMTRLVVCR